MERTIATNRKPIAFSLNNKTVIDTFAADGWTKSGSGTTGTWAVDAVDTYNGRSTLKLVTAGAGAGSRDYATKSITPVKIDGSGHVVFELVAKLDDINGISRFYADLYIDGANYYEIMFESTGNKWGFNGEYETFRATIHKAMNSKLVGAYVNKIRFQISDQGNPITMNMAELSYYVNPNRAYIVFSNDDGTKSGYDFMHSVLQPLGIVGSVFPSSENIVSGEAGNAEYADKSEILQLEQDGFEIGVHGASGDVSNTATDISFDATSKEIRFADDTCISEGFIAGQFVSVSGTANNNGKYTVESVTAGAITVLEDLVDESAGASMTVNVDGFATYGNKTDLLTYIDAQIAYFRDTVGVASEMNVCAYPNGETGKDSSSFIYQAAQERFVLARTTHDIVTECLIPEDNLRLHVGSKMYFKSANNVNTILSSIANLTFTGGIGIIVSHDIKEAASDSYNYNLTDATTIANYIASLVEQGRLEVIKLSDIPNISA